MKRQLSILFVTTLIASSLTACGHEHTWSEATCIVPRTCLECGETEGEVIDHVWLDASCTTPKTCSVCGETNGEALGHNYSEASYDSAATCSVCGDIAVPAQRESISFDNLTTYNLPFAVAFSNLEHNAEWDYPEYSLDPNTNTDMELVVGTATESDQEDYIDLSLAVNETVEIKINMNSTKGDCGKYSIKYSLPKIILFDYYSGLGFPSRVTMNNDEYSTDFNLNNENGTYNISSTVTSEANGSFGSWIEDSEVLAHKFYNCDYVTTFNLHLPKDYDGLCIAFPKAGSTEVHFTDEDDNDIDNDNLKSIFSVDEDGDSYAPEDLYYVRVSDLLN